MRGTSLVAVGLTGLLVLSVLAGGGLATETQDATAITQCRTITEPGSYELTTDLTYSGSDNCISIAADDVVIDGNGHSIVYDESASDTTYSGQGIIVSNHENVTIRGVAFEEEAMLDVHESTAVTVENNRFNGSAIIDSSRDLVLQGNYFSTADAHLEGNEDVRLTNNRIEDGSIVLDRSSTVTARDNRGTGRLEAVVHEGAANVINNSLRSITVSGYRGTSLEVGRNHVTDGGLSVTANGVARVHNNTVEGGGMTLGGMSADFLVAHNTITGSDIGVRVRRGNDGGPAVELERNVITDNRIGVRTASNLPEIHRNDLSGNSESGVVYTRDDGVVNATHNSWGGRPSSLDDEHAPFEDPATGALANGSGTAVSEGADPGVSNVRFDPWLDTAPDAGVERPSNSDDSTQTTTPTTTTTATTTPATTTTTSDGTTTTSTATPPTTTSEDTATTSDGTTTTSTTAGGEPTATTTPGTTILTETTSETTPLDVPGFGHLGALLALLATALFGARRT